MYRLVMGLCSLAALASPVGADDWPQWLGPERDGVWRETGVVAQFPKSGPTVRWRTPLGGGYAGPAVVKDRVFVTDRLRDGGPAGGPKKAAPGKERVLCLEEATGKLLWKHEYPCTYQIAYPAGPRATPLVHDDKVYTLGAMGDLLCLEAATGKLLWSKNFPRDFGATVPQWGFAAHPLLDGDRLICMVGGEGSVVVAFHKDTGKELWRSLTANEPGYCPPMIYQAGGKRQLIIWHPQAVAGLDPETGKSYWSLPFQVKAGIAIATPRRLGDMLFVSCFYGGSLMLTLDSEQPGAKVLWKRRGRSEMADQTDALHSLMCTPFLKDGHIYGVCSYGHLRCLKADTGQRLWETLEPTTGGKEVRWANAFLVAHEDRFFLFNEKGDLIIARLSPKGYQEIDRAHILEPSNRLPGRPVVWSHPAFANRSVYARNDAEIVCASLAEDKK
jgi:outer membrane protein assembly factor BamB